MKMQRLPQAMVSVFFGFHKRLLPLVMLVAMLGTTACGEEFEAKSVVLYLRVVGIKADVPRVAPGQGTTLSALVVTPSEDDEVDLLWEVCPFTGSADDGYPCVFPEGMPVGMQEAMTGRGETFEFEYVPELAFFVEYFCSSQAELLERLPEGLPVPNCDQGYPARARLTATIASTGEEVVAVKTLNLLSMSVPAEDNHNPVTTGMVPGADAPLVATVGEAFPVECPVDVDALDVFTRMDDDEARQEEVLISWFVRGGSLDKDMSFFSLTISDPVEAQENEVTADEAGVVTVWCVLRDGRGGTDWSRLDIEVR